MGETYRTPKEKQKNIEQNIFGISDECNSATEQNIPEYSNSATEQNIFKRSNQVPDENIAE